MKELNKTLIAALVTIVLGLGGFALHQLYEGNQLLGKQQITLEVLSASNKELVKGFESLKMENLEQKMQIAQINLSIVNIDTTGASASRPPSPIALPNNTSSSLLEEAAAAAAALEAKRKEEAIKKEMDKLRHLSREQRTKLHSMGVDWK